MTRMENRHGTLLIYAPVPVHDDGAGGWLVERQASNGLRLWAEHFERVLVMMPVEPAPVPAGYVPFVPEDAERIEIVPLPTAYRLREFARHLRPTRQLIREQIVRADYLSFAIGGLIGDWGAVAAHEARRMGRKHAIWTDRVESEVTRHAARAPGYWRRRLWHWLTHRPMAMLERRLIRRADLGLFHGAETFAAYSAYSRNPQIVHDIHIARADHISSERLATKLVSIRQGETLRICYVGRADAMKGPYDWLEVLRALQAQGVDFHATWLGDGTELEQMRTRVEAEGLAARVSLPGFCDNRETVLETLRDSHLFLFCHLTPESPRNLIEALISATPVVGYGGAYVEDLISGHGGGALVPLGDTARLADEVAALAADRTRLAALAKAAVRDGEHFTDEEVFRHRSEIIQRYLGR